MSSTDFKQAKEKSIFLSENSLTKIDIHSCKESNSRG